MTAGRDTPATGAPSGPAVPARRRTVLAALVLGGLVLLVGTAVWVRAETTVALDAVVPISVTGAVVAPAVNAGGLVVLAAACALALGGTWGRRLAAAGVVLGGILVIVSALSGLADPRAAAVSQAQRSVGVGALDGPVVLTPMPWVAVVLGVAVIALGLRTVVVAGRWAAPSRRHEGPRGATDPQDAWDALSRGEDPT